MCKVLHTFKTIKYVVVTSKTSCCLNVIYCCLMLSVVFYILLHQVNPALLSCVVRMGGRVFVVETTALLQRRRERAHARKMKLRESEADHHSTLQGLRGRSWTLLTSPPSLSPPLRTCPHM